MSIETQSRPLPVSILSPEPSSPQSSPALDATFATATNISSILSPQAEPFSSISMATTPALLDGRASLLSPPASVPAVDADAQDDLNADVDPQLLEALKSKDRIFVLRVGDLIESLINERKLRIEVTTTTSYQRLLVHRCSAYYKVLPESESTKVIAISHTPESRVPQRRVADLVPAEATKPQTFKIMRRLPNDRGRSKPQSRTGSVGGEDADLSDPEPSESGSQGGRGRRPMNLTLEQREAAYNEARSRIFMGFEGKPKEKENDMSASSSTFSLVSGSASTSGGGSSSAGDIDDSASTAATESEWSAPVTREKKGRASSGTNSVGSSSRSHLSSTHASSSRNSRATSPSFGFPAHYEPPPSTVGYDHTHTPGQPPPQPYMQPYMYPYPQSAPQGYMPPYPYYPYGYHPHMTNSDPTTPSPEGMYLPQHPMQQVGYMPTYAWQQPAPQGVVHSAGPSPAPMHGYPPYAQAPYGAYSVPGYFPPPPHGQGGLPPHMAGQQGMFQPMDAPPQMNGNGNTDLTGNGAPLRPPLRNGTIGNGGSSSSGSSTNGVGKQRRNSRAAQPWSYGPGVAGGFSLGGPGLGGSGMMGGPIENFSPVGPRLSGSMRKTSSNSNSSSGNRTPGDEASSVASSTSSSSRRTFTSTASSQHQHPLPARPDWAVGLKAQPTLAPAPAHTRHHEHHAGPGGAMSPRTGGGVRLPQSAPALLQPADFPPLSSPAGARPAPGPRGAWNNPATRATILSPPAPRPDDGEQAFERPQPKPGKELFNPKARKDGAADKEKDAAGLAGKMGALGLDGAAGAGGQPAGEEPS